MTQEEFFASIENTYKTALELTRKKNVDYGGRQDCFQNFRMAEQLGISMEHAILVRMSDKLSRIATLLRQEALVKDESLIDTLRDMCNYSAIMIAVLEYRNAKSH